MEEPWLFSVLLIEELLISHPVNYFIALKVELLISRRHRLMVTVKNLKDIVP